MQLKDSARLQEAFTYFLQAFPDDAQAPAALAQRALAYQESKNYSTALSDLNMLLGNYPKAKEREAALQQKALILGQLEDGKGMSDAFRQLLKEFPKTRRCSPGALLHRQSGIRHEGLQDGDYGVGSARAV